MIAASFWEWIEISSRELIRVIFGDKLEGEFDVVENIRRTLIKDVILLCRVVIRSVSDVVLFAISFIDFDLF